MLDDPRLQPIAAKVLAGERLSAEDGITLYRTPDLLVVGCVDTPVVLMLRVFVSSINSAPEVSAPRRKTGICKRMRGDRLRLEGSTRLPSFKRLVFIIFRLVPRN